MSFGESLQLPTGADLIPFVSRKRDAMREEKDTQSFLSMGACLPYSPVHDDPLSGLFDYGKRRTNNGPTRLVIENGIAFHSDTAN